MSGFYDVLYIFSLYIGIIAIACSLIALMACAVYGLIILVHNCSNYDYSAVELDEV